MTQTYPETTEGARLRSRAALMEMDRTAMAHDERGEASRAGRFPQVCTTIEGNPTHLRAMADKADRAAWVLGNKAEPHPVHGCWNTPEARKLRHRINGWSNGRAWARVGRRACSRAQIIDAAARTLSPADEAEFRRRWEASATTDELNIALYALAWCRSYGKPLTDWPGMVQDLSEPQADSA